MTDAASLDAEAREVLGAGRRTAVEPLVHNPKNGVTARCVAGPSR
ncbi:hypothetical protein ACF05L_18330 [Streptomyces bobili]